MAKVLLVEDEIALAQEWVGALEENLHSVSHCTSVPVALATIRTEWPEVVVLDFFFKDPVASDLTPMSGLTFISEMVKAARKDGLPLPRIVGVTGAVPSRYFPVDVMESAELMQRNALTRQIRKPFSSDTLVDEVSAALEEPPLH